MQEDDARLFETLQLRCAVRGMLTNQSEVVWGGLGVLAEMTDSALCEKAAGLEQLSTACQGKALPCANNSWPQDFTYSIRMSGR